MRIFNYLSTVYNKEALYCFIKEVCNKHKYCFDIVETNMFGLVIKCMKEVLGFRRCLDVIVSDVYAVIVLCDGQINIEIYDDLSVCEMERIVIMEGDNEFTIYVGKGEGKLLINKLRSKLYEELV